MTSPTPPIAADLIEPKALREYFKLKYMGDCKCGQCQLVPMPVIEAAARTIETLTAQLAEAREGAKPRS